MHKTKRPPPRPYHHGDLKNALLDVALRQIARDGVGALSIRSVTREAGVSHASTYRHFPNKESVLATIAEQGFRLLTDAMRLAAREHAGNPLAMLHATGIAYVNFGVTHPEHLQVMFGGAIVDHANYPTLMQASKEAYDVLDSLVRDGQRSGAIRKEIQRVVALAAWAQVHGLTLLIASRRVRAEHGESIDHNALADSIIRLLLEGLANANQSIARR